MGQSKQALFKIGFRKKSHGRLLAKGRDKGIMNLPHSLERDRARSCKITKIRVLGVKARVYRIMKRH